MSLEITTENFSQHVTEKSNIVIKFTAPAWCGPCKRMAPEYHKAEDFMKELGSTLVFAYLDVDLNSDIAEKYNITSLPTLVLIKDGVEIDRHKGGIDSDKFLLFIGKHFDVSTNNSTAPAST